ncbi:tRNA lysidine(34) synthetase TilS [Sporosarcina siberiensis]|uniref:tRNA(Ile)-lysidine synthase n=1 Tax=Sporosarcina siberiensis TaxID=1365606 RepID=A0ABW4SB83_9BACL
MNTFDETVFRFIKKESLILEGSRVLIACSGGVDSVVLLHFIAMNRERWGVDVAAIHVDHMLRGEESEEDGAFVRQLCDTYGIPFFGRRIAVPEILSKSGGNMQAVCREERYSFFSEIMLANKYNVLVTAHHGEDQLETVLMQVTKGNIPKGMPMKREINGGILTRPFLPVVKASLYSYAIEKKLEFREDPSNQSTAYLRNRFRQQVLPFIVAENPAVIENTLTITRKMAEDDALLEALAKEQFDKIVEFTEEGLPSIDGNAFIGMPNSLQRRVITLLLNYLYDNKNVLVEYKYGLIEQLQDQLTSQVGNISIDLPLGYKFIREYGHLSFVKGNPVPQPDVFKTVPKGVQIPWGNSEWLYWTEVDEVDSCLLTNVVDVMYFNLPKSALPLHVRYRKEGDRMLLPGMSHPKRLSRLFIDEKVGTSERLGLPVLVTAQDEVCAVPGLRYGTAFKRDLTAADKYIFVLGKK